MKFLLFLFFASVSFGDDGVDTLSFRWYYPLPMEQIANQLFGNPNVAIDSIHIVLTTPAIVDSVDSCGCYCGYQVLGQKKISEQTVAVQWSN